MNPPEMKKLVVSGTSTSRSEDAAIERMTKRSTSVSSSLLFPSEGENCRLTLSEEKWKILRVGDTRHILMCHKEHTLTTSR
jgi:hypothetical protein